MNKNDLEVIPGLTWTPWVGDEFLNLDKDKILLIGESHYYETEEEKNQRSNDKLYTIKCFQTSAVDKSWHNNTYNNLSKIINRTNTKNFDTFKYYAYTNLVQRIIKKNSRPTAIDYIEGYNNLHKIIDLLKPNYCVFIGVESFKYIYDYLNKNNITHGKIKQEFKINGTFPRTIDVNINDHHIHFIAIKHLGKFINLKKWLEFIDKETNNIFIHRNENNG